MPFSRGSFQPRNPPAMQETWVWSLGWEDHLEKGKDTPLQYSGLENSMDWIVHGVAKSRTWLSTFHSHYHLAPDCVLNLWYPSWDCLSGTSFLWSDKHLAFSRVLHWISVAIVICFPFCSIVLSVFLCHCTVFTDFHKYRGCGGELVNGFACPCNSAPLWLNMIKWWNQ